MEIKLWLNRTWLVIILYLFVCTASYGQTKKTEESFSAGIQAMQDGNISTAILHFENVLNGIDRNESGVVLYYLGTCYQTMNQPEKACICFEQAVSVSKNNQTLAIYIYPYLLYSYCDLGKSENALSIVQQMDKIFREEQKVGNLYWDYAVALLTYYLKVSDYTKTVELGEYVQLTQTNIIKNPELGSSSNTFNQNSFYMGLALCYEKIGNYKMALKFWVQALNYVCAEIGQNLPTIYYHIGYIYNKYNDQTNALKYYLKSLEDLNKYDEYNIKAKAMCYMEIGVLYKQISTPNTAISYLEKAKELFLEINDTDFLPYIYAYLYFCNQSVGDINKLDVYADLLLGTIGGVNKWDDEQFLICNSAYGSILEHQGKYKEAVFTYQKVIEKKIQLYGDKDIRLFPDYYKLASLYLNLSDIDNSKDIINKALFLANNFTDRTEEQLLAKFHLIEIDRLKGNLGKAISDCENLKVQVSSLNDSSVVKSGYYGILGGLYAEIGAYDKFLDASIKDCEVTLELYGDNSPHYATTLLNLSEAYAVCNKQAKSIDSNVKAVVLLKSIYGEKSNQYYDAIHKLGNRYAESEPYKALDVYADCMKLSKELYGEKSIEYANDILMYYRICILQNPNEIKDEDIKQYAKGISIKKEIGFDNNISYFTDLSLLSAFYYVQHDYENRYFTDKEYYEKVKGYIKENFIELIEWQRDGLWEHFQNKINSIPSGAVDTSMPSYNKLAYNCALLNKTLLLTSSNSLSELINDSKNEQLKDLHQKILNLKVELNKINDSTLFKQKEQNLYDLQREEITLIKELGGFMDFIDYDWTDIKNALKQKEAAIEFISYPTQDCISYAALVLTQESMYPMIYPLFNDKEFEKYSFHEDGQMEYDYANPNIYRIVWNLLDKYALNGIETIYFSPDGLLHKMPIESLVDDKGVIASQKWELYRVSSTREIVKKRINDNEYNAVLYGGLNYDFDLNNMVSEYSKTNYYIANRASSLPVLHNGVNYLIGTKEEVTDITNIIKKNGSEVMLYEGDNGTEESFYSLSDQSPQIIHLATHGFWWNYEKVAEKKFKRDNNRMEMAMLTSGLLFSGCNTSLKGEKIPDDIEDGILTALEISKLNFSNTNLVVLSACQSGLGKVSSEGVYGLQRGFKLAGAGSLLMSLWPVDDLATKKLMVEFYKNFLNGETKAKSLLKAQQHVKAQGYEDPEYWAGFILLDALN